MKLKKYLKEKWALFNPKFSPELKYDKLMDMSLEEAIRRVDENIDNPMMYSNEPMLDIQAWERIQLSATIGNHIQHLQKTGGKQALQEWINNLP